MINLGPKASRVLSVLHEVTTNEEVRKLKQTGHNKGGGNYKFYSQIDLSIVSKLVQQLQCVLVFSSEIRDIRSNYQSVQPRNGSAYDRLTTHCACDGVLRLQCIEESGDWISISCYGFKVDQSSDKALGAATIAKRYGIMQLFDIATVEGDPDGDDDIRIQDKKALNAGTSRKGLTKPGLRKKTL